MEAMNLDKIKTPAYIVDEGLLERNLSVLKAVMDRTGCKILLAQKGFSMFAVYPLLAQYLAGTTASSLFEAKLGFEEMGQPFGKETHIFAPAYIPEDFVEILEFCDDIVFNSLHQWLLYKDQVEKTNGKRQAAGRRPISCGLRINPGYSEIETDIYNPCILGSRFGISLEDLAANSEQLEGLEGIHFHTMCEQNSDVLKRTLEVVEAKFGVFLKQMKWINFGGGHHITRADYDIETLVDCILCMKEKYQVDVYLEPGEAVALNTGFLAATVLDTVYNGMDIAILDTSAACHMPDVLEMPYRPEIIGAGQPKEREFTYRLGGHTCLAGDVIGDYSFDKPLKIGDKLIFYDMAHYSMVKTNTFNGINLPDILLKKKDGQLQIVKTFGYQDFKGRLS